MALTDDQKNALATGAQYAGYGAAIGAPIGGPVGAGIGAGVGFVGGLGSSLLGQGPSEYEQYRQEQIDELKRRQEMGLLGLTDEERANLQAQLIDPVRSQQRQQQLQTLGAIGSMGGGPADVARMGLGQQQRIAEQIQPSLTEIARADLAKQRMEEERLLALQREQDKQLKAEEAQRQKQITQGLMVAGGAIAQTAAAEGQAAAMAQQQKALLAILQGGGSQMPIDDSTVSGTTALMQSIYPPSEFSLPPIQGLSEPAPLGSTITGTQGLDPFGLGQVPLGSPIVGNQ